LDLNLFYSRHQIALIRAGTATSAIEREHHLGDASDIAQRIGTYQHAQGAAACAAWYGAPVISAGAWS